MEGIKSELFDVEEFLEQPENVPSKGKRIYLRVNANLLDQIVLKSDTATLTILEIEMEISPGVGRLASISDILVEYQSNLEKVLTLQNSIISGYFQLMHFVY